MTSRYHTALDPPHWGQELVLNSPAKMTWLQAGRRWGKGRCAIHKLLRVYADACETPAPGSLVPPFHCWIVVPTFPQGRQTWEELIALLPRSVIRKTNTGKPWIMQDDWTIFLQGSGQRTWGKIEVKSSFDPDALQTVGLDFLWVQEAQDVADKAFQKLLPTLRSPNRMGIGYFEGIPSLWAEHWFQRGWTAAHNAQTQAPFKFTAFQNPHLAASQLQEIEDDRDVLTETAWRRMYLAEFSESAGFFKNITECVGGDVLAEPLPGTRYVAGMDLGRRADPSSLIIMDASRRQVVYHRVWDREESWPQQREGVAELYRQWGFERFIIDATGMGGDIFTQELQEMNVPVEPFTITQESRKELLNNLAISLERQTVSFPGIPSLLRQLRAFQFRRTFTGNWRPEAPPGEHDDDVFALALATEASDAPVSLLPSNIRRGKVRYAPTQDDIRNGGLAASGVRRRMQERQTERMRERMERSGMV